MKRRDDPKQSRDFIKKARELEADEKASAADTIIGRLEKQPYEAREAKPQKK